MHFSHLPISPGEARAFDPEHSVLHFFLARIDAMLHPKKSHFLLIHPDAVEGQNIGDTLKELHFQKVFITQNVNSVDKMRGAAPFDLILMGGSAEEVDLSQAFSMLKNHPQTQQAPILFLTQNDDPAFTREMLEKGASGVLPHPFEKEELHGALLNLFKRVQSREILHLIKQAQFFDEFDREELQTLIKVALPRRFEAGETILAKGDPADRFFILLEGNVEVINFRHDDNPYSISIQAGSPFGDMAILDETPRSAFCIAADDCLALEIGSHIINDTHYNLRLKIFAKLAVSFAQRLRQMNAIVEELQKQALTSSSSPAASPPHPGIEKWITKAPHQDAHQNSEPPLPSPVQVESGAEKESSDTSELPPNPFERPTAQAEVIDERISSQEEYDVLTRKIALRTDFIATKLPKVIGEVVCNKLYGYFTGSKLAKMNPHTTWSPKSFTPGTPRLKRALHMVTFCPQGQQAFEEAYLQLPLSHKVVGKSQTGCVGTFLSTPESIQRFLQGQSLHTALPQDLEMAIERLFHGEDSIEYLTHTPQDLRQDSLLLCFDTEEGKVTGQVREAFPQHQVVTVVKNYGFDPKELTTFFTMPEEDLTHNGRLCDKNAFLGEGFYRGQTLFLPDLSLFFQTHPALQQWGTIFSTIAILAGLGPDYSGVSWGSKGGAEGAVRAARAMYGIKGAESPKDLANAINWADE